MLAALASVAALPWLQGFFAPTASSDAGSYDCVSDDPQAMVIHADVAGSPGVEQIVASYHFGIVVRDRAEHVIAQLPGLDCEGSADELVAIAAGDGAIGVPLLAIAATSGGFRESRTLLTLYRVSATGGLQPVFSGEVERHERADRDNEERLTRTGIVTLIPGGLVYRDPSGGSSLWIYDAKLGRYRQELAARPSVM